MAQIQIDPIYILLAGLVANVLTAAVKRQHWSATATKLAGVVLSGVSGFVAVLAQQKGLDAVSVGSGVVGAIGVNQTAYALLLNQTPLGTMLSNVFNPAKNPADANVVTAAEVAATVVSAEKPAKVSKIPVEPPPAA